MNQRQRWILFGAAAVIISMLLFPPFHSQQQNGIVMNMGYAFIFDAPRHPYSNQYHSTIDVGTLLAQWSGVVLVAGILWFACRDK